MTFHDKALIVRDFLSWLYANQELMQGTIRPSPMVLLTWLTETPEGKAALGIMSGEAYDIMSEFAFSGRA